MKIRDRIIKAITEHGEGGIISYYDLAILVFPRDKYPRAFIYPTRGGPPGCYMALTQALVKHNFYYGASSLDPRNRFVGLRAEHQRDAPLPAR